MSLQLKSSTLAAAVSLVLLPSASSAAVIGFLGNFDVINDTGTTAHGFEIELEDIRIGDVSDTFGGAGRGFGSGRGFDSGAVVRYGAPTITEKEVLPNTWVTKVTYFGLWDTTSSSWDYGTPSINPADPSSFVTPGDNCWTGGGVGYGPATPCDHFGVGTIKNPTKTTYSWLHDDGTNSGTLTGVNGKAVLPAPVWDVQPQAPVDPGLPAPPPVVGAQIQMPQGEPLNGEPQFGEAMWVKVFTTELEHEVELEDLIGGNPVIDQAVTEVEWQLLQTDPGNPNAGKLEKGYGAPVGAQAASIIRRYEFYSFGGSYNLETHEAILNGNDSNPGEGDVGHYLGAQNAAANLQIVGPAAVPLPTAVWMMGSGLMAVLWTSRRRRPMSL